jgi:hypothetical protein
VVNAIQVRSDDLTRRYDRIIVIASHRVQEANGLVVHLKQYALNVDNVASEYLFVI